MKMNMTRVDFEAYLAELSPEANTLIEAGKALGRSFGLIEIAKVAALEAFTFNTQNTEPLRKYLKYLRSTGTQPEFIEES